MAPREPQSAPRDKVLIPRCGKRVQDNPKMAARGPKVASRWLQENPKAQFGIRFVSRGVENGLKIIPGEHRGEVKG